MTISCTRILREGERPEYRYPLGAARWPAGRRRHGAARERAQADARKLQSLLPRKFRGVAAATASACAGTFARPADSTNTVSRSWLKPKATRLTTTNRTACRCAASPLASKVQWRFSTKLLRTATSHAIAAAT